MPVYFIGDEDSGYCRIKIGVAKDIEKRRTNLQTGNPSAIRLLGWINSEETFELERRLHHHFAATRVPASGSRSSLRTSCRSSCAPPGMDLSRRMPTPFRSSGTTAMPSPNISALGNGAISKSTRAAPSADVSAAWPFRMPRRCITASTATLSPTLRS